MATKREWDRVINHWTRLASGKRRKGEDIGSKDCAFCQRYLDSANCLGCPIYEETTIPACIGTPYDGIEDYLAEFTLLDDIFFDDPEFMKLAKKELDFLLDLRKKVRGD